MTAGKAALAIFVNAFAGKLYMTGLRVSFQMSDGIIKGIMSPNAFKANASKFEKDEDAKVASKAQLNNAEYSGLLCAALLFLHVAVQGEEQICGPNFVCDGTAVTLGNMNSQIETACGLIVLGSLVHLWGQILVGPFPFQTLGGLPRYIGMFMLVPALQVATMRNVKQFSPEYQSKFATVTVPE
ncbi:hypothetical protein TrVE_jg3966 [Triparma verrucosa]|uniref:Uncharacterized protein n=1 Tax=Triparma verrucosa TaxID=1606542 RepID=A0A9W7EQE3_9STRA|nr:hypothetical protein TrVE_jg3966 [Triparma verrucosa]